MKIFDVLTFGPTVLDAFYKLKGRRAIEAMAGHKELAEIAQTASEQKNELIKEHGTNGAIAPGHDNWETFISVYEEMGLTDVEIKSKFQFTDEDIEKLELSLADIQALQKLGYYP